MSHPIDYHFLAFYFEENPVASHPQPVFRGEVSEPLYISREVIRQGFDLFNEGVGFAPVNCSQVFDRPRFEFDLVDHSAARLGFAPVKKEQPTSLKWFNSTSMSGGLAKVLC